MKVVLQVLLLVLLIISGVWLYRKYQQNLLKKKEIEEAEEKEREEIRQQLYDFIKSKLNKIRIAKNEFSNYLDHDSGYFANYQLEQWKRQYLSLFSEIEGTTYEYLPFSSDELKDIKEFIAFYQTGENLRLESTISFVDAELKSYSSFFDNIEGRKLDHQQRKAIITDEDNNIVIAGAGSGKTTTIVGKVNYVIDRYKVNPEEILLISFTNKSAATLASRINIKGVDAKTFHKLGKDIIAESEAKQPSIFDENQFKPLLTKCFKELLADKLYLKQVTTYFTEYMKPVKSQFEFDNQGDYIQYIKDKNFRTYKTKEVTTRERTTYKMEVVKSIEECKIANFLLFNGIEYEYEFPYEFDTANEAFRQYKPDFTIKQNDKIFYLEHLAVSRDGSVPKFFTKERETQEEAKSRYWEKIFWSRDLHQANKTILIETFSYEMSEGVLFDNLTLSLKAAGITIQPKSPEEVWQIINNAAQDEINTLIALIGTFITLLKSNNYTLDYIRSKNTETQDRFSRERSSLFMDICTPVFDRYENYLRDRGEIDFSDMINKATNLVYKKKHNRKYSYIIIDEFQDISIGRYQLVKSLKTNNPACKIFAVGDDWQSIYRFSGSDIALFKDFEKYFGYTVRSKIETTYRFHEPLIRLSSDFILKNPNQTMKELKGVSAEKKTSYKIQYSTSDNQDDSIAVQIIFNEILSKHDGGTEKEVYILGRYGFDIDRIKNLSGAFLIDRASESISYSIKTQNGVIKRLKAQFMTIHKAKGLEADIVIVLNCNSGKLGFPSELSDDSVLNLLLSDADQFENGEERRLFYVAMTRARELVYFVTDSSFKSKFISEIEAESLQSPNKKCPQCRSADLVLRKSGIAKNGNTYKLFGCSNYLYGCDFTTTEWINN